MAGGGIALGRAAENANVVNGQGTLDVLRYGAILPARTLVDVRGAGITYDGQYFVESCTHTIKPGSYKQSFTLSRNALIAGTGPLSNLFGYVTSQPGLSAVRPDRPGSAADCAGVTAVAAGARLAVGPLGHPGPHRPAARIHLSARTNKGVTR